MNILLPEEVDGLRRAWQRRAGVRATARALSVNRETVAKYFAIWNTKTPDTPSPHAVFRDRFLSLVARIAEPEVIHLIDAEIARLEAEAAELRALRVMALRRQGHRSQ